MSQTKFIVPESTFHAPVIFRAVCFVILSLFLLFFYFLSIHVTGIFGLISFFVIVGTAGFLGIEFFVVFFLVALFLQNILVASVTTIDDPNNMFLFTMSLGTSFFITCLFSVYSGVSWLGFRQNLPLENRVLLRWTIFFSLVAIIYSGLGFASSDIKSVLTYLRVYLGAVMFLCIGVTAGYRISSAFLINAIRVLAILLVIWGIAEFCFAREVLEFFNVLYYTRMKFMGTRPLVESLDILMRPQSYLNLSGQYGLDIKLPRLEGPNIHAISYAYELAFCGLVCFMYRYRTLAAACFAMLVLVGSKGAIMETCMSLSFYILYCILPRPRLLLFLMAIFISAYITAVTYYGLASQDFHILGLIGSIHGFLADPLGRGVGVGGNMSTQSLKDATMETLQRFQHQGTADFALESGFGVMLYQLGIATLVFLVFYHCIFRSIWDKITAQGADKRMVILPLALILVLVNSLFQEEAFSPVSIGLWLFLSGFFLAGKWREEAFGGVSLSQSG